MKVCSHYIPSLGQTRNNLTFEKGLTAEKNPNPRALLLSARNAAELLFTPTIRSFHLLRVLLVFPPLPLLSLSSSCFHLILTPSSSRLFSLKCFFFRDALFISVPLYLPTRLSRQPLGFLPKRVFFFFFFLRSMSVLCYPFFPLSLHLSLSSSLCVSRFCFCRERFSWRHCSVSTQAHTNHAGCCRGEAAAMCVCQSLLKDPRCSRAAMQFSSPASADIFPLLSLLPFFIPPPPTHLFLPISLSLVSVFFHAVSNPQSLSFMPSTNTHVVLLVVCVRVKALSQTRVSHQCCCSQKKGILLFFAFLLLLSRSSWTWEEDLRGNVSVSHGAMLICVYVSDHAGFSCLFSLMCILLSPNSKIKHVSLFVSCVCECKCLCWCVCVCEYPCLHTGLHECVCACTGGFGVSHHGCGHPGLPEVGVGPTQWSQRSPGNCLIGETFPTWVYTLTASVLDHITVSYTTDRDL